MDIITLKKLVCEANIELNAKGLVTYTWGNVSGIDRENKLVAIKPSGVPYKDLTPDKIPVLRLENAELVEGSFTPSCDTPIHLELYRAFPEIGGIAHSHSTYATAFAQAMKHIPCFGTTHADYFFGAIPVTRKLSSSEIDENYEANTGKVIAELWKDKESGILNIPAALVAQHGPFTWGISPEKAVESSVVLEETARMAILSMTINPEVFSIGKELLGKHFLRKHGNNAYYGQK
ncbi:MAG: L-ribulose-5-phosphate 4-epimerase [Lentisphaerae bacterium GWF2_44_16]|nr:MAG: L-ribulose-5-phosphate 4-epimerase [Lentisphaerae bacterium GWF2_44_16]